MIDWSLRKLCAYVYSYGNAKQRQQYLRMLELQRFWESVPVYDPENFTLITESELWN